MWVREAIIESKLPRAPRDAPIKAALGVLLVDALHQMSPTHKISHCLERRQTCLGRLRHTIHNMEQD